MCKQVLRKKCAAYGWKLRSRKPFLENCATPKGHLRVHDDELNAWHLLEHFLDDGDQRSRWYGNSLLFLMGTNEQLMELIRALDSRSTVLCRNHPTG